MHDMNRKQCFISMKRIVRQLVLFSVTLNPIALELSSVIEDILSALAIL